MHGTLEQLEGALDDAVDSRQAMDAWKDVHTHYPESFGPQAATIGPPDRFDK